MDVALFRQIVDETCYAVLDYTLHNDGESLLLKDFPDRLAYVYDRKLPQAKLDLYTNGMLLCEETSRVLVDHEVTVTVSFDGACAETFEGIRRGSNFIRICRNVEALAGKSDRNGPTAVGLYIAVQDANWRELPAIVKKRGGKLAVVAGFGLVGGRFLPPMGRPFVTTLAEAANLAEELGVFVDSYPTRIGDLVWMKDGYVSAVNYRIDTGCDAAGFCASVFWDGEVQPCCCAPQALGSLKEQRLLEIWRGDTFENFRRRVNDPEHMPEKCRACPMVNRA